VLFLWLLMKAGSCSASYLILWLASWTLLMEAADLNAEAYIFTCMVFFDNLEKSVLNQITS